MFKFQVANNQRLGGVLGTDKHTHALSVLYYRLFQRSFQNASSIMAYSAVIINKLIDKNIFCDLKLIFVVLLKMLTDIFSYGVLKYFCFSVKGFLEEFKAFHLCLLKTPFRLIIFSTISCYFVTCFYFCF